MRVCELRERRISDCEFFKILMSGRPPSVLGGEQNRQVSHEQAERQKDTATQYPVRRLVLQVHLPYQSEATRRVCVVDQTGTLL